LIPNKINSLTIEEDKFKINWENFNSRQKDPAIFVCSECGQRFTRKNRLNIHLKNKHLQSSNTNFVCPQPGCGKIFNEKGNLKVHYRIHNGERPYKCSFCELDFISLGNKRDHERRHANEKPYQCNLCPKTYYRRYLLTSHL
jgi:uncharacterized Zn-finger protein